MEITGMKASVKFSREEDQPNPLARLKLPFIFHDLPFQSRFSASDLSDLRLELLTDFPNAPSFGLALRPLNHNSPLTLSFRSPSSFPISISAEFKPGSPFHHSPKISLSINHKFGDFSQKSSIKIPFKDNNNNNNQARLEIEDQDDDDGDDEEVERRGFSIRKLILPSNATISAGTTATSSVALFNGAGIKVHWGLSLPVVRDGRLWWSSLQAAEFPVSVKKITLEIIKPKKRFENRLEFGEKKKKDECEGKGINDILHVRQEKSLLPDTWPSLLKSLF